MVLKMGRKELESQMPDMYYDVLTVPSRIDALEKRSLDFERNRREMLAEAYEIDRIVMLSGLMEGNTDELMSLKERVKKIVDACTRVSDLAILSLPPSICSTCGKFPSRENSDGKPSPTTTRSGRDFNEIPCLTSPIAKDKLGGDESNQAKNKPDRSACCIVS